MSKAKDEAKRQRILQAATKVFASKGYRDCKISDIARESQVADGTIYLYYRNKEDLLRAVFEANLSQQIPQMKQALAVENRPLEQLRIFIQNHFRLLSEHSELARSFHVESQNAKLREYLNLLTKVVEDGQRDGHLREDVDPTMIERVVVSTLSDVRENQPMADSAEQVYQILIGGLVKRGDSKVSGVKSLPSAA